MKREDPILPGSILDTDLYKLTMGYFVLHFFPHALVDYQLTLRSPVAYTQEMTDRLEQAVAAMADLTLPPQEQAFLSRRCSHYLPEPYQIFLQGCRFRPTEIQIENRQEQLSCTVQDSPWFRSIYWEVPLMAIISEIYFDTLAPLTPGEIDAAGEKALRKGEKMRALGAKFIEMGTRRRRSYAVQDAVLRGLIDGGKESFLGTSNVHFAAKYDLTPHGTMAHELFSAIAAMYGVEKANNLVLGKWAELYHGYLGMALPDTFTSDFFLQTFDRFHAMLFDGCRHDSGDPFVFADKFIRHYQSLGIDPRAKKLVFSDGISSLETIEQILDYCGDRAIPTFGIGTFLTNDFQDLKALNMVFKLTAARENARMPKRQAVKLSDVPGKHNGDPLEIAAYKQRIGQSFLSPQL